MSIFHAPAVENAANFCLVPVLKKHLFPNAGTLAVAASALDYIGAGAFAIRESISQGVATMRNTETSLPSNIGVPGEFEFELPEENGGEPDA